MCSHECGRADEIVPRHRSSLLAAIDARERRVHCRLRWTNRMWERARLQPWVAEPLLPTEHLDRSMRATVKLPQLSVARPCPAAASTCLPPPRDEPHNESVGFLHC